MNQPETHICYMGNTELTQVEMVLFFKLGLSPIKMEGIPSGEFWICSAFSSPNDEPLAKISSVSLDGNDITYKIKFKKLLECVEMEFKANVNTN